MVYRVAIIGHSQVPKNIQAIDDAEIRIYRKPGARLANFDEYEEYQELFNWHHEFNNIIFMGGSDKPSMSVEEIQKLLLNFDALRYVSLRRTNKKYSLIHYNVASEVDK